MSVKVLVIDDSKTIRRTAYNLLSEKGFEVITATDGFNALPKIVAKQPSIIFVDEVMPDIDGYQICGLIKNNQQFKDNTVTLKNLLANKGDEKQQITVARDNLINEIKKIISNNK